MTHRKATLSYWNCFSTRITTTALHSPILHRFRYELVALICCESVRSMAESYLDEENLVYRLFNEIQATPKKQEQYAEILAELYCHSAEVFASQFSNCVYAVLLLKASGKIVTRLIQFIAAAASRCSGNETIPPFSPLLVDVTVGCGHEW